LEVNLTRTGLAPTYLTLENQGSRSSLKQPFLFENIDIFICLYFVFFVFLNYLKICAIRRERSDIY